MQTAPAQARPSRPHEGVLTRIWMGVFIHSGPSLVVLGIYALPCRLGFSYELPGIQRNGLRMDWNGQLHTDGTG